LKKYFCIALLFAIIFNAIGLAIYFPTQQYLIKREIKLKLKKELPIEELTAITLQKEQIEWEEENEFRYAETMWDVVKQQQNSDGSTTYYCINDSKENMLFINLNKMVKKQSDKENTLVKNMLKLVWNINSKNKNCENIFKKESAQVFDYTERYHFDFAKNICHPPEIA